MCKEYVRNIQAQKWQHLRSEFVCLPSVLPSFPMMHFMARIICSVTGGDMAEAYTAL